MLRLNKVINNYFSLNMIINFIYLFDTKIHKTTIILLFMHRKLQNKQNKTITEIKNQVTLFKLRQIYPSRTNYNLFINGATKGLRLTLILKAFAIIRE